MVGQKQIGLTESTEQLIKLLAEFNQFVFCKDIQHRYVNCNQDYAKVLGYPTINDVLGLTDDKLNPLYAPIYKKDDNLVLQGENLSINNPAYFKEIGIVTVTGKIMPFRDYDGNIIGVIGTTNLSNNISKKSFIEVLKMLDGYNLQQIVCKNSYIVKTKYGMVKLSRRETQCILLLFKSYTADDIAYSLGLSKKSIESYFVNIKNKLNLCHKSQIIDTVINGELLEQL
jgi:DNA-binding CsgD family transcriptional regulator